MHIILFLLYVAGKLSIESRLKAFAEDDIGYHKMTHYHLWSCISTGMKERANVFLFEILVKVYFNIFNYSTVVAFLLLSVQLLCRHELFSSIRLLLRKNSFRHSNVYLTIAATHAMANNEIRFY